MAAIPTKPFSSLSAAVAAGKHADFNFRQESANAAASASKPDFSAYPLNLPTPPNSLSPELHAHKGHRTSSIALESEIDLQDAVEHAQAQDQPTALSSAALSGLEASAVITPSMLAKHHLPDILLPNGPMAIRYILNCLTQSVPGFSSIPPPKARRLVVSALEIRGGGGLNGDVEFEKVGWGRWDARTRGQPPREGRGSLQPGSFPVSERARLGMSPPLSVADSYAMSSAGLQIPEATRRQRHDKFGGSWAADSMLENDLEMDIGMNVAEHEADKMSLDGSEDSLDSDTSSSADEGVPGREINMEDDDATDEEDWAAIGPEALKHGSLFYGSPKNTNRRASTARMRSSNSAGVGQAKSVPRPRISSYDNRTHSYNHSHVRPQMERRSVSAVHASKMFTARSHNSPAFPISSLRGGAASQHVDLAISKNSPEREAIEALLKMGSM
ncbi:hypothetical protein EJ05DRAFT_376338 [Pseudovirgaria hyperparasitica]|uniref:Sin3 binding protein-domain-containing protein n=1 Tax=Pseudovirgaria hyperparasitica TaxID=470096 RepID=A0A6A6W852_9PEZI|nr:uncharacterized protein EJ05DRAFT_376338 [Pseudovirgaria hyperparasitica]KAF2758066.1 hypothetical protein EJ05DRAFT_376338 [Pseudovirgaria hyperparasitica]